MKKIQAIITAALLVLLVACGEEDYAAPEATPPAFGVGDGSNGSSTNPNTSASLATVLKPESFKDENGLTTPAEMEDDKSGLVYLHNPDVLATHDADHVGQRILYNYDIVPSDTADEKENATPVVYITQMMKILTKAIDFPKKGKEDEYGHDGIHLINYTRSSKHLTFMFQLYTAGGSHRISLIAKEGAAPDEDGYLTLELRHHNESGQANGLSQPSYVSFLITDAPGYKEGTLKGFRIEYKDLNHEKQTIKM